MSHRGSETDVLLLQGLTQRQHRDMRARGLKAVMLSVLQPSHTSANRLKLVATRAALNPKLSELEENKTELKREKGPSPNMGQSSSYSYIHLSFFFVSQQL